MIRVEPATAAETDWAARQVVARHYLHSAPDPRGRPFCYVVRLGTELVGCLWFGRPESTRCYDGGLTYGGHEEVAGGRAAYDRWEILNLSRVWFSPDVQPGGRLYSADHLPGFTDRQRCWRSTLASVTIRTALARVGWDYLLAWPPVWVDEPYRIRAVLSYCDTKLHKGTIYRAAGFTLARVNDAGIETWWTPAVADLSEAEDASVRAASRDSGRCQRTRYKAVSLFDEVQA